MAAQDMGSLVSVEAVFQEIVILLIGSVHIYSLTHGVSVKGLHVFQACSAPT